jgi:hypothetical protein
VRTTRSSPRDDRERDHDERRAATIRDALPSAPSAGSSPQLVKHRRQLPLQVLDAAVVAHDERRPPRLLLLGELARRALVGERVPAAGGPLLAQRSSATTAIVAS